MGYKTISLREDVYEALAKMKAKNESFSDVISRLMRRRIRNNKRFQG